MKRLGPCLANSDTVQVLSLLLEAPGWSEKSRSSRFSRPGFQSDCHMDCVALGKLLPSLCLSSLICIHVRCDYWKLPAAGAVRKFGLPREHITWLTEGLGEHVDIITALDKGREASSTMLLPRPHTHTFQIWDPSSFLTRAGLELQSPKSQALQPLCSCPPAPRLTCWLHNFLSPLWK